MKLLPKFLLGFLLCSAPVQAETPLAIGMTGSLPRLHEVQIENRNVYDYTFSTAPTDWWVQSGIWEMTNRWDCSPGWSWFGGRSEEIAAVWNKRKFSGDFSMQFYFAFKMGIEKVATKWHYHPRDVGISFCGDGKNLGSGYSFIVGADGNLRSDLMRQNQTIGQSHAPEALLFAMTDSYPSAEKLHRRWWLVKVNKIGNRIECWLENKLIISYDDPKPLAAGQMAIWTYNNGIMLARVQIFYENEVRAARAQRTVHPAAKVASIAASGPKSEDK